MKLFNSVKDWFDSVVNKYNSSLTGYVMGIIKIFPPTQEIVQEVFLRLWKNGKIDPESSLKVWLFKTSRNLSIDYLRKEKKMSFLTADEEVALQCPEKIPSEVLEEKNMRDLILEKLKKLPEQHQEVIQLKFKDGLSYKEISKITGYTESKVGVLIHRGMINLRASFSKEEL